MLLSPLAGRLIRPILAVALIVYLGNQVRKPTKWAGRFFVWLMNHSHSALTDWGLSHARIERNFTILDVGCGGGRTIQKLAALAPGGRVHGIDYADGSVAASLANNSGLIAAGRVEIRKGPVSQLPFADETFDLVTAIETQYYWPDPANDFRETLRVLKKSGTLLLAAESYRRKDPGKLLQKLLHAIKFASLSPSQYRELLSSAGYEEIEIFEERTKRWICVVGRKG